MEGLSISSIWKLLKWLPPFFLKRVFTKEKLADLILVDILPRHEVATVNLGDVASYRIWLQFVNISPFDVEIDRAELRFYCAGLVMKSVLLKKTPLASGQISQLLFSESMTDGHANQIAKYIDNHQSAIEMDIEFNCKLHNFSKVTSHLSGIRPEFMNENWRLDK